MPAPERTRRPLEIRHLGFRLRIVRVHENGNQVSVRYQFVQQRGPLRIEQVGEQRHAGHIAARPIEAIDNAEFDGVAAQREDDRNRLRCRFCRSHGRKSAACGDQRDRKPDQFGRQQRQSVVATLGPAKFDGDVAGFDQGGFV